VGNASLVGVSVAILVAVISGVVLFAYFQGFVARSSSSKVTLAFMHVEGIKVISSGGLAFYVSNDCGVNIVVDEVMFIDPESGKVLLDKRVKPVDIPPGKVGEVVVPAIYLTRVEQDRGNIVARLYGVSTGGTHTISVVPTIINSEAIRKAVAASVKIPELALLANTSATISNRTHWVVFNYVTGRYWLYSNYTCNDSGCFITGPKLAAQGYAPILRGVNAYTASTGPVWIYDSPIKSPIVIVVNPTYAQRDWDFKWTAYTSGNINSVVTTTFHLEKLGGNVVIDFLVFWEDMYNPAAPGYVDDWRDHVVRVTQFTNGTFRIAVYLAKGYYEHRFFIGVKKPYSDILANTPLYTKYFGQTLNKTDSLGRYVEYKVIYTYVSG